ncbi:unnamed protein product [Gadus morhua 'NCC']
MTSAPPCGRPVNRGSLTATAFWGIMNMIVGKQQRPHNAAADINTVPSGLLKGQPVGAGRQDPHNNLTGPRGALLPLGSPGALTGPGGGVRRTMVPAPSGAASSGR